MFVNIMGIKVSDKMVWTAKTIENEHYHQKILIFVIVKATVRSEAAAVEVDSASFTWSDPESPTLSQVGTLTHRRRDVDEDNL